MQKNAVADLGDTYLTLGSPAEGLYKEKGSRFMAFGYPVSSEDEALEAVKRIRDKYHDARHHCWAYRLGRDGSVYRTNDDGEPSGTAGRPIHGAMMSAGITDTVFVVVRYFGGLKLGTSGLIEAYRTAVKDALSGAEIVERQVMKEFSFTYPYAQIGRTMKLIKGAGAEIRQNDMSEPCRMKARIRAGAYEALQKSLSDVEGVEFV